MRIIEPWQFVLVALAAARITRFLTFDSLIGSNADSGSRWSKRLNGLDGRDGIAYRQDGSDRSWLRGKVGDLLVCPYCLGFHASWITLVAWWWGPEWLLWVITAWAVAGAQALLNAVDKAL